MTDTNVPETNIPDMPLPPEPPSRNKKVLLTGLLAFFLLAGTTSAYGYFSWDWFKSARQVYLETEAKNCQALLDSLDSGFQVLETDYQLYLDESIHSTHNITANISSGASPADPQTQYILGILQSSKITLDFNQDPKTRQATAKIDLSVNGASPITLQAFQDNERAGLAFPAFSPKFLVANYADEETIRQNLGIESMPRRITTSADWLKTLKTSKAELAPIYEKYAKIYSTAIQKEQVKAVSGKITEGDVQVKGKIYTISFNETQARNLLNALAEQLAADEQLAALLYTKYTNILDLYETAGMKADKVQSKEDISQALRDWAAELRTSAGEAKPWTLVISIDKDKKIVERTLAEDGSNNTLKIANWSTGKQSHYALDFQNAEADNETAFQLACTIKQQDEKQQTGTLALKVKETGAEQLAFSLDTDFTATKDTNRTSQTANFTLSANDSQGNNQFRGTIANNEKILNEGKKRLFNTEVKVNLDSPAAGLQGSVLTLNTNGEYEFGKPVTLPQLDASNSLDLGQAARSDLEAYTAQLQQGIGSYIQSNPALMQMFFPIFAGGIQYGEIQY
ncbi:MAG TPA: DUF6583 family protein [Desulfitobacteriaceae bacterium]|nr:DUF6583 family protein [Desulfitobacteriaceae bacterium]